MAQICFRIDTEEHVDCTKRSFRCVIVRLRLITVITEGVPLIQDIAERFASLDFFGSVLFFSTIHSCSDVSNALLRCCLTARRSDSGNPRISSSMAYSSLIRFRASSAVALLLLMYTSWIFRRAWAQHATSVSAPPSRSALNNLS